MAKKPGPAIKKSKRPRAAPSPARARSQKPIDSLTATAEILRSIASSEGDLHGVLQAIAETGYRLFGGHHCSIARLEGDYFRRASSAGEHSTLFGDSATRLRLDGSSLFGRAVLEKRTVHVPDLKRAAKEFPASPSVVFGAINTVAAAPLMRNGTAVGAMVVARAEKRPFRRRELQLLESFADQAVIAIENARLLEELNSRNGDLAESLEQQTATAEIMRAIASSPDESTEIFETIVTSAQRLLRSDGASIMRIDGGAPRRVAVSGISAQVTGILGTAMDRRTPGGRAIIDKCVVHVEDLLQDPEEFPAAPGVLRKSPTRTVLAAPLMRDSEPIGAIALQRTSVRPFVPKEIELLKSFADQAVIAIENARLLNELRESLAQQTATSEVLGAISESPGDLEPVFDAILDSALALAEADSGILGRVVGDEIVATTIRDQGRPEFAALVREGKFRMPDGPESMPWQVLRSRKPQQRPDMRDAPDYRAGLPVAMAAADKGGLRTVLFVPIVSEDQAIGNIAIYRREVRPFDQKHIDLVSEFAKQAAIAIENARLLEELNTRNRDLAESLEQQTATSEVLRVIASSPGDVERVLDTIVRTAQRLLAASGAAIARIDQKGVLRRIATTGQAAPISTSPKAGIDRGTPLGRATLEKRTVHVEDILQQAGEFPAAPAVRGRSANRTILATPLMREDEAIGAINVTRAEVRPFTAKEIELLESFADQAVIAIENARLLEELNASNRDLADSLETQTASAEILGVIAASPSDSSQALNTIAETAARLFGAAGAGIRTVHGDRLRMVASAGRSGQRIREELGEEYPLSRDYLPGYVVLERRLIHIPDTDNVDPAFAHWPGLEHQRATGIRTNIGVPLMREGQAIGALMVQRSEMKPFTETEIAQLHSFADQAVIAVENARLLDELNTRNRDLAESLDQQTATSEVLGAISASPGELTPVFEAILRNGLQLCDASMGHIYRFEDGALHLAAIRGAAPEWEEYIQNRGAFPPHEDMPHARTMREKSPLQIPDLRDLPLYASGHPGTVAAVELGGVRTALFVPLLRGENPLGVIVMYRRDVRPFSEKLIALVENFADQAVIAIENARLLEELNTRNRDLSESLDQQTATSEVLRAIASSPGDAERVLDTIARTAQRLLAASGAAIARVDDGGILRRIATAGQAAPVSAYPEARLDRGTTLGRAVIEKRTVHVEDLLQHAAEYPTGAAARGKSGNRTILATPLMREGEAIGAINVTRMEVRPFTTKEMELLESFADQAVIAIENARLLEELKTRNRDLAESLEQQTATAEILRAIASSPASLAPVLQIVAENAGRLCEAPNVGVYRLEGNFLRTVGSYGPLMQKAVDDDYAMPFSRGTVSGHAIMEKRTVHIPDLAAVAADYPDGPIHTRAESAATRTILTTPLLREGNAIGAISVFRTEVRPFTNAQVQLVESFADQAVIAIENARLLGELRESLDRQTATSEVLGVISSSPGELQPVFETMLVNAVRICGGTFGMLAIREQDGFRGAATHGVGQIFADTLSRHYRPVPGTTLDVVQQKKETIQIIDCAAEPAYDAVRALNPDYAKVRTHLCVPMLRENELVGAILIYRDHVLSFTDKQIGLVENFADQAVIAIENARLLDELRESLERRTAIAEVLSVISSSPGEVEPVFEAMLENAVRLCDATEGSVFSVSGNTLRRIANRGLAAELVGFGEIAAEPATPPGRMLSTQKTVHIPDLLKMFADQPTLRDLPGMAGAVALVDRGARTALWVPMVKDGVVVGAFVLHRRETRPFTAAQIGLVETFANQAVIAIENARLLTELRTARDTAEQALSDLRLAQASLIQSEKMASLGQLTAGIAHEIKNPLNFINNFAVLSVELLDELTAELTGEKRAEVEELIEMLTGNLDKVAEHGRRADGIVKSMLAHSRGGSGERQSIDLNALVEESLNLAYHGARAQDQNFNVTMERELDPSLSPIEVVPQDLTRVFLNLFGNGFYAANKRRKEVDDAAYRPAVRVTTQDLGAAVAIRIRDNGVGIPPEMRPRLFEPFFTTKPTGEGTGLGLSISYEIVTRQHGGSIEVESVPGEFTEFCIRIPKRAGSAAGAQH